MALNVISLKLYMQIYSCLVQYEYRITSCAPQQHCYLYAVFYIKTVAFVPRSLYLHDTLRFQVLSNALTPARPSYPYDIDSIVHDESTDWHS